MAKRSVVKNTTKSEKTEVKGSGDGVVKNTTKRGAERKIDRAAKTHGTVKMIDITERTKWDKFVKSHPETNFLQSWDFYEFHLARGKTVVRRAAVDAKGQIVAAYAGVVETAKRGTYMAVAGGPVIGVGRTPRDLGADTESSAKASKNRLAKSEQAQETSAEVSGANRSQKADDDTKAGMRQPDDELFDKEDRKLAKKIFADMRRQGEKNHCVFVRVRPQWELGDEALAVLRDSGFRPAPMYLSVEYAGILDLRMSEEEILAGASQGLRRKIRKANKEDLTITAEASERAIADFCELEKKHAERQKYVAFAGEFLRKQFEAFARHGEVLIYTAKNGEEILAQNFMIFYGAEASYHYGVSSEAGTRISAAPLLHLAAMAEARRRGCVRYNLWGIVGRDEKEHRFYGVSEFKRSFGCEEFRYTSAHDLVLQPLKYQVTRLVETTRKKHRQV